MNQTEFDKIVKEVETAEFIHNLGERLSEVEKCVVPKNVMDDIYELRKDLVDHKVIKMNINAVNETINMFNAKLNNLVTENEKLKQMVGGMQGDMNMMKQQLAVAMVGTLGNGVTT